MTETSPYVVFGYGSLIFKVYCKQSCRQNSFQAPRCIFSLLRIPSTKVISPTPSKKKRTYRYRLQSLVFWKVMSGGLHRNPMIIEARRRSVIFLSNRSDGYADMTMNETQESRSRGYSDTQGRLGQLLGLSKLGLTWVISKIYTQRCFRMRFQTRMLFGVCDTVRSRLAMIWFLIQESRIRSILHTRPRFEIT